MKSPGNLQRTIILAPVLWVSVFVLRLAQASDLVGGTSTETDIGVPNPMKPFESRDEAIDSLLRELKSSEEGARVSSLRLLRGAHSERVIKPILSIMANDPNWLVRYEGIRTIQKNAKSDLTSVFSSIAESDPNVLVRIAAIRAMGRSQNPSASVKLNEFLRDKELRCSLAAASELARRGDAVGYDLAINNLSNVSRQIRKLSAETLMFIANPRSLPLLKERLEREERNVGVQKKLLLAIRHIELLQRPAAGRNSDIVTALRDKDPHVRDWAIFELRSEPGKQAIGTLEEIAGDPQHPAQKQAVQSLQLLEDD